MKSIAAFLFSLAALTLLTSCGGDSSDEASDTAQRTGTVGILLTDKPADPSLFLSVNAAIEKVELMGSEDDEDERIELYGGPTLVFELLDLRNESIPLTFQDDVPVGTYCKIRLTLSDLELVLADDTPLDDSDNETFHPNLPGNGKLDLVAKDCFDVGPGEVVTLQIDIDAGNSIHIVGNGNRFNFRPVAFIDVLSQDFDSRLVRLHGTITKIDDEAGMFYLCGAVPATLTSPRGCVEIQLGEDSAHFDNLEYEGMPRSLSELLDDKNLNQEITVVGWPQHRIRPYVDIHVPGGHLPPPGQCKLWLIGRPPGLQAAPIDCDDVPDELSEGIVLVTHTGVERDPYYPLMRVEALAVESGEFLQVDGEVATTAPPNGFTMSLAPGTPIIVDDTLDVQLLKGESEDINGTRIVSKSGHLLEAEDIVALLPVQVDGVLELGVDSLKAALVILDVEAADSEQVTGTIDVLEDGFMIITPDATTVCGLATDQLEVELAEELNILTVIITDDESLIEPGGTLAEGQTVGMNGVCESGGYATDNVVIVDDQRDEAG